LSKPLDVRPKHGLSAELNETELRKDAIGAETVQEVSKDGRHRVKLSDFAVDQPVGQRGRTLLLQIERQQRGAVQQRRKDVADGCAEAV